MIYTPLKQSSQNIGRRKLNHDNKVSAENMHKYFKTNNQKTHEQSGTLQNMVMVIILLVVNLRRQQMLTNRQPIEKKRGTLRIAPVWRLGLIRTGTSLCGSMFRVNLNFRIYSSIMLTQRWVFGTMLDMLEILL